jgi:hypothetical protein
MSFGVKLTNLNALEEGFAEDFFGQISLL